MAYENNVFANSRMKTMKMVINATNPYSAGVRNLDKITVAISDSKNQEI